MCLAGDHDTARGPANGPGEPVFVRPRVKGPAVARSVEQQSHGTGQLHQHTRLS